MTRRTIISGLATLLVGAEQSSGKIPRIGILSPADSDKTAIFDAFRAGLRDLGWVEGHNIVFDFRLAHGDAALLPRFAVELASVPVVVAPETPTTWESGVPMLQFGAFVLAITEVLLPLVMSARCKRNGEA